jgi:hypothetical protein
MLLAGSTLLATACGSAGGGPVATPAATPTPAPAQPVIISTLQTVASPSSSSNSGANAQPAIDAALRDAATHLGVAAADLHVDQVEARQWPDAALGCPKPGVLYAQILTPGFLVVVSGGGKTLEYHADSRGRVVLCQER